MAKGIERILSLGLLLTATTAGAEEPPEVLGRPRHESPVVARVADEAITAERFAAEMMRRGGEIEGRYATSEQRRALLDELILRRALVARARAEGYETQPEVVAVLESAMVARLVRDRLEARLATIAVKDEDVELFYAEHQDELARPARIEVAIVWIAVAENAGAEEWRRRRSRAEEALRAAEKLDRAILHFDAVAREYSDHRASSALGGSIGWLVESAPHSPWDPAMLAAIFALERPGQVGPIVEARDGFYLVKLMAREPRQTRPLEALRDGLRARLLEARRDEARRAFYAETLGASNVEVDEDLLAAVAPPPARRRSATPAPPPVPERPANGF